MIEFLKCKICGEHQVEIIGHHLAIFKKIHCLNCGFSNERKKEVEIEVIGRKKIMEEE